MIGLGKVAKDRLAMEESIMGVLRQEPEILESIENGTSSIKKVQERIRNTIERENKLLIRQKTLLLA